MANFTLANCTFQLVQLGDDIVGRLDSPVAIPEDDSRSIVTQWYDSSTVYFMSDRNYYRHLTAICQKPSNLERRITSQRFLAQLAN